MHLFINPRADRARPYGDAERAILSHAAARAARQEISRWPGYAPTPLRDLRGLAGRLRLGALWYKDEASRFGLGSFKALGGAYGVMRVAIDAAKRATGDDDITGADILAGGYRDALRALTVTTATDGNHGRSVAWGARMVGCRCVIYLPRMVSEAREAAIRGYGADIVRTTAAYDETVRQCQADAARLGRCVVSDTSYPGYEEIPRHVMQGYTVMVAEAMEQMPGGARPTHAFIQAGVGGLAAAVVAHMWEAWDGERPTFVIVEPARADCLFQTARAGRLTPASGDAESFMAGLACAETSPVAWRILEHGADAFITIPDEQAAIAMRLLARGTDGDAPIVGGESGVAGLAGLLAVADDAEARTTLALGTGSRVLLIGTEGATDTEIYEAVVGARPAP